LQMNQIPAQSGTIIFCRDPNSAPTIITNISRNRNVDNHRLNFDKIDYLSSAWFAFTNAAHQSGFSLP
ncbi:MAG: hypothetical protein PVH22_14320, partial [Desulfobacteraceae bacterium]